MKKLIAVAAMTMALFSGVAQATSVAIVDLGRIAKNIPQSEAVAKKIQSEFSGRVAELKKMEKELAEKEQKLKRDEALLTDTQKRDAVRELEDISANLKRKLTALNQDGQRRQAEENQKILVEIQKTISEIAGKEGFDIVIERKVALYAKPEMDISSKVIEHMGKK